MADSVDLDDDNDGTPDIIDAFPLNASESSDYDGDGIGDNRDMDDDNDGFLDVFDRYPRFAGIPSSEEQAGEDGSNVDAPQGEQSMTLNASNLIVLLLLSSTISISLVLLAQRFLKTGSTTGPEEKQAVDIDEENPEVEA